MVASRVKFSILLFTIWCAQPAVAETSLTFVVDSANSGNANLEGVTWYDAFMSQDRVHAILIGCCSCIIVHKEVNDRLVSESTMERLQELVVHACSKSQKCTEGTHKFEFFTLQQTQDFFTEDLPWLLRSAIEGTHKFVIFQLRHTRYFFAYELPRLLRSAFDICLVCFGLWLLNVFKGEVMEARENSRNHSAATLW